MPASQGAPSEPTPEEKDAPPERLEDEEAQRGVSPDDPEAARERAGLDDAGERT